MTEVEVTEFLALLALLLGGGMIGAGIMKKIKFPTIIGFIIIGMIAGPYGLGIVDDVELINLLAELGIIILLFVVGLEFSLQKLRQAGIKAIIVGMTELSIMFFLAYVGAFSFGWSHIEALYLAGILSISSTAISLRLMRDMKLVKTKEFNTIITILIVEDLAAVLLLVILGNASTGEDIALLDVGILILQSLTFFVIAIAAGIKLVPKLLDKIHGLDIPEGPFITALALGFGLAVLAHFLGQSSAIGAFIMGMIIASSKHSEPIIKKVLPLRDFFGVIFFVSIGMLVNIKEIPEVVLISIPIIILAVVGKFVGNFFGSTMSGHNFVGASTVGSVMVPRGEFSFIMAKQAVDSGAVRDSLYPVTMLVTLATMLCMPLLLKILPTLADKNSLIPLKVLNPIFIVGQFFNQLMQSSEDDSKLNIMLKQHGPKLFINTVIVIAILAVIDYFKKDMIGLIVNTGIPLFVEPELLLTIVSIILIIYPIISLLGRVEKIVSNISDAISTKLIPGNTDEIERKPMHRLIRNIFFIGVVLVLVALIDPYIAEISEIEILSLAISVIGFGIAIILITDSIFVFQKISRSHIMDSLLKEDEKDM
ncbi:MAG: cation:proton antiporter [Nitrosopumilus sp.]|nr:cation:proton antiporter [Nitrosopumilus sp.]MDH3515372.1 cation:proton antiporter [Nitrosopumilus sp.]MDH3564327.1 cation:proton antiporter [Nitrosopumilus sp.]MDH5417144.1 cation:proton antiporter [Nitrosopumilus sp.]MDH5555003.1 cation:proton antiporter [Nitrosopumilus sp.]